MVQKKSNSSKTKAKHGARVVTSGAAKKEKLPSGGSTVAKAQEKRQKGQYKKDKPSDKKSFDEQLHELGLHVKEVTADGNCFFRAVADQLEGKEFSHAAYRQRVVDFIESHKDDFQPFVEDDVPFADYCTGMREDATWAGNLELQAASLLLTCNICIHQLREPRWNIVNFEGVTARTIHLSYHDGVHYNSVRRLDDPGQGPALPIVIEADLAVVQGQKGAGKDASGVSRSGKGLQSQAMLAMVMASSGCSDEMRVTEVLREVGGDAAAAIEFLIAQGNDELDFEEETPGVRPETLGEAELASSIAELADADRVCQVTSELDGLDLSQSAASSSKAPLPPQAKRNGHHASAASVRQLPGAASLEEPKDDVRISRNKPCPCNSKKKYKSCCGANLANTAASIRGQNQNLTNKERKEQQRHDKESHHLHLRPNAKSQAAQDLGTNGSGDLGSLCI